jgi:hypothetical protein
MLKAIWNSAVRVLADYPTWAGALSAVLAWTTEHWGWPAIVPPSVWWALAALFLFAVAVRSEMAAQEAKAAKRKPSPTWSLQDDVLPRLRGTHDLFGPAFSESGKLADALADIREKALLGQVTVFARKGWRSATPASYPQIPREPVPADLWKSHSIEYLEFLKDRRGAITPNIPAGSSAEYIDLWFDEAEVRAAWPSKAQPLNLRAAFSAFRKAIRSPRNEST